jgi:integrase
LPSTLGLLAAHLQRFPVGQDGLIFTNPRDKPWRRNAFGGVIRQARISAGLPDSVSFHDLRHFYASTLIAAGCSIKAVQTTLGHSSAAMTLDVYSHLFPSDEERIRDAVEAASRVTGVSWAGDTTL